MKPILTYVIIDGTEANEVTESGNEFSNSCCSKRLLKLSWAS